MKENIIVKEFSDCLIGILEKTQISYEVVEVFRESIKPFLEDNTKLDTTLIDSCNDTRDKIKNVSAIFSVIFDQEYFDIEKSYRILSFSKIK